MDLKKEYVEKCRAMNIRPKRRKFLKADRLARAYSRIAKGGDSQYISIDIDGKLSYFLKIIGDQIIVSILTKEELSALGYLDFHKSENTEIISRRKLNEPH